MMKNLKTSMTVAVSAMAIVACVGASSASGTTLEVNSVAQNSSVSIEASIQAGGSTSIKPTSGGATETCTGSVMKGSTVSPFSGATVTLPLSSLTFTGCTHKTTVIKAGTLHIAWTSNTHAAVSSSGSEVTTESTIFGISCIGKTNNGTTIGTLTGVSSGLAILDVNGVISKGACGDATWTGTYTITSPLGLGVIN